MRRRRTALLALALAVLAVGAYPAQSMAAPQLKIRSVFRGPANASAFIELQMVGDGQNQLGGNNLNYWTFDMNSGGGYTLNTNVANGQNQRMVLLRDAGSLLPSDYQLTNLGQFLSANAGGGLICWETVDCVAWGTFNGSSPPSPVGTPIVGGLSGSQVSVRGITRGCPTFLDGPDDTDDSNSDFGFAVGYPVRGNSATPTETPCATSPTPTAPAPASGKKKCAKKKKKSKSGAAVAKKKKCKKRKK